MIDKDLISELKPVVPYWATHLEDKDLSYSFDDPIFVDELDNCSFLDMSNGSYCLLGELYDGEYSYSDSTVPDGCKGCLELDSYISNILSGGEVYSMRLDFR